MAKRLKGAQFRSNRQGVLGQALLPSALRGRGWEMEPKVSGL